MKKQKEKNQKWLVPVICLAALLLVVGIAAMLLLPGREPEPQISTAQDSKLYWNVEREIYKTGTYAHRDVGDNLYRLLFSVDGEQVQLDVQGMELVNYIDTMDVMGLVFDENGIVVDARAVPECTGGYAVFNYYVQSVDGNTVTANSNYVFRGHSKVLQITEQTGIYHVADTGPLCGIPGTISYNDTVTAVQDREGNVTHIFVKPYEEPGDIYWNVDKLYDSVNKITTRQPNELMQYEIDFIVNGEAVTLRCRDLEVVNLIDSARIMGLEFDENGYIIEMKTVRQVANGGRPAGTNYYVSDLNYKGGQIQIRNKAVIGDANTTASFFPAENMVVYDMTGNDGTRGKQTQLQVNDRIIFILDSHSMITEAFVTTRLDDSPLYWNVDRDWNKTTKSTNRTPDKNGWYYFTMAANGKHVTVKTDSLEIANAIESPVNVGLRLDGDVVKEVLSASKVHPGGVFASYLYVKEIREDGTIVAERTTDGVTSTKVAKVSPNCEFYNVSQTSVLEGEKISLSDIKVGDTIHGYKDFNGDISILYVVGSVSDSPIYWNVDKTQYWDAKNKVSTRTTDANGYYNILFAVNGEQVTLRTRDKKMVDDIDNRTCMGLKLSGNTILKVYGAVQTVNTKGGLFASSYHVTAINGNTVTATKLSGTDEGKTVKATMAYNCQVFDVSSTAKLVGEKTSLQVGDQIRGLLNGNDQISVLYVLTASNHAKNHKCDCCEKTPVWLAWDGSTTITKSGHYVLSGDITAAHGIKWTEDLEVTLCLNGHKLTVDNRRVFGNTIGTLNLVDCAGTGCVHGTTNNNAAITMVEGGTVNIYGGTFTAQEITEPKNGGLFTIISGGKLTMYGGVITGGKTNGYGGNINVSDGTFTLNGGTVSNGSSAQGQYGGNIALTGENAVMIMNGGTVSGGTSGSYGGNIAVTKAGARLQINGGVIENGSAATHGGNITVAMGAMTLANCQVNGGTAPNYGSSISAVNDSSVTITDASITGGQMRMSNTGGLTLGGKVNLENLYLYGISLKLSQDKPLQNATIGISMKTNGVFCEKATEDQLKFFHSYEIGYAAYYENNTLFLDSAVVHRHCDCGGTLEHTCDEEIRWIAYEQDMVLQDGGHYHLTTQTLDNITIADGATVYLCLNGQKLSSNARVFGSLTAGNTLHIFDCAGSGVVHGMTDNNAPLSLINGGALHIYGGTYTADAITAAGKNGGLFAITDDGKLYLHNGTISGGKATGYGGNINVSGGTLTVYGGVIENGTSAEGQYGGNVALSGANAAMVMKGGVIRDGNSGSYGGNIALGNAGATLRITGGTVENGTAATHGGNLSVALGKVVISGAIFNGGTVGTFGSSVSLVNNASADIADASFVGGQLYARNSGGLTLGGQLKIDQLYLLGIKIQNSETNPLTGSVIGIAMEFPGVFMENAPEGTESFFTGIDPEYELVADAGVLSLVKDTTHKHCVCVGAEAVDAEHQCEEFVWQPITGSTTITADDNFFLDFTYKAAAITVADGVHARLCLNGGTIFAMKTITLGEGSTLDICDCSAGQTGKIGISGGATRGAVVLDGEKTINLYSGTITGQMNSNKKQPVVISNIKARFNMYGGKIVDGVSTANGGNVQISNGQFHMYGGQITGGSAKTYGGNVAVTATNAGFYLHNGKVYGGSATTHGGNICVSYGKMEMEMGEIYDGNATTNGGNLSIVNGGYVTITGGSVTTGTAGGFGNCIYNNSNNLTIGGAAQITEIVFGSGRSMTVFQDTPLTGEYIIRIGVQTLPSGFTTLIRGTTELSLFECIVEGYMLEIKNNSIILTPETA